MIVVLILLSGIFTFLSMLGIILHNIMNSLNHGLMVERGYALERNSSYSFVNVTLSMFKT